MRNVDGWMGRGRGECLNKSFPAANEEIFHDLLHLWNLLIGVRKPYRLTCQERHDGGVHRGGQVAARRRGRRHHVPLQRNRQGPCS